MNSVVLRAPGGIVKSIQQMQAAKEDKCRQKVEAEYFDYTTIDSYTQSS